MFSAVRSKLTYANVVATLALFVALGGSSYAAISLSNNSVKSKHIASGAVKRSDIGRNAVNSSKVADRSLRATDFAPGQLSGGPKGDKGDAGPKGVPGTDGTDGADGNARAYARVSADAFNNCTHGPFNDECAFDHAKGVASVFRTQADAAGVYCVEAPGLNNGSVPAAVTVDYWNTEPPQGNASAMIGVPGGNGFCPEGVFEVVTERHGATTTAVAADNVGFTILIP